MDGRSSNAMMQAAIRNAAMMAASTASQVGARVGRDVAMSTHTPIRGESRPCRALQADHGDGPERQAAEGIGSVPARPIKSVVVQRSAAEHLDKSAAERAKGRTQKSGNQDVDDRLADSAEPRRLDHQLSHG